MSIRKAETIWKGTLREGSGNMKVGSGAFNVSFSHGTRFGDVPGTNPEELIGAAQAGCFSMFLSSQLTNAGYPPEEIHTQAQVHFGRDDVGPLIQKIELETRVVVEGISQEKFDELVEVSKQNCPISRALRAIESFSVSATISGR